jgi:allantoin racemase
MTYRYLLINPNSSSHITARLAASARAALESGETLSAVNAAGEPAVVRNAATLVLADRHAERLCDTHGADADAVLLGISLDGAVEHLRHRHPERPVVGMTEAALMSACLRVRGVGVLTLGPAMVPLYQQRMAQIGLSGRVVGIEAPEVPAAFLPITTGVDNAVLAALDAASARLQAAGAEALVLAGAVLCGYAPALSARRAVPVFDGMACAVMQARTLLRCKT